MILTRIPPHVMNVRQRLRRERGVLAPRTWKDERIGDSYLMGLQLDAVLVDDAGTVGEWERVWRQSPALSWLVDEAVTRARLRPIMTPRQVTWLLAARSRQRYKGYVPRFIFGRELAVRGNRPERRRLFVATLTGRSRRVHSQ